MIVGDKCSFSNLLYKWACENNLLKNCMYTKINLNWVLFGTGRVENLNSFWYMSIHIHLFFTYSDCYLWFISDIHVYSKVFLRRFGLDMAKLRGDLEIEWYFYGSCLRLFVVVIVSTCYNYMINIYYGRKYWISKFRFFSFDLL